MYNLTVAEAHTFYVGDGQWLVHNAGCYVFDAAGNPNLRALRRPAFDSMKQGIEVNGQKFEPKPAQNGAVEYINPQTGTSVFVSSSTGKIVGIWPQGFKR